MQRELDGVARRRVCLITRYGPVEGDLHTNPSVSTLHYLNVVAMSESLLVLHPPIEPAPGWNVTNSPLGLSIESVLLVREISEYTPTPGDPIAAASYQRCPIRLNVGDYALEGHIHLLPGSDPIARLNQDRHAFIALSAVSAVAHDNQFAAPFVAVQRSEIQAIQAVGRDVPMDAAVDAAAGPGAPTTW